MPLWLLRGARVAVGRALPSASPHLLSSPGLAGGPASPFLPPLQPSCASHLLLVNSGKEREKKRKNREMWSCQLGLGPALSDRPHGAELGPELGRRAQAGHLDRNGSWNHSSPGARAGTPPPPPGRGALLGEVERRAVKGRMNLQGLSRIATHHLVQLPPL